MVNVEPDQLVFALHGPDKGSDEVDAAVFAAKLSHMISALKEADKSANGKPKHQYVIQRLQSSTPTVFIKERDIKTQGELIIRPQSGIDAFRRCAAAVFRGDKLSALEYGTTARKIERLATGVNDNKFSYAEVYAGSADIIRVDDFLRTRAASIASPFIGSEISHSEQSNALWFSGAVTGTFDGILKAVDLRGAAPECILVVGESASITCIFDAQILTNVSRALNKRVRLTGLAIYDSAFPLPVRFQIADIEVVSPRANMMKWRGAFEPFEPLGWEDDVP